ncbi:MAG: preprotein translocase subunit SecG [Candidatus Wallbacteria bacterium]|nr:preprotein translocase subunit SecG [Candidatus Wallbacteria bacterium]
MDILMNVLIFLHIVVSIAVIVIVLFQANKGEGLAGAFGGGASFAVFGDRGPEPFMAKLTIAAAVIFMITSFSLAYLTSYKKSTMPPVLNQEQQFPQGIPDQGNI